MSNLKLIYFDGCPNSKNARAVLLSCGVEFDVIKQDDLNDNDEMRNYSSPTILLDNELLFGEKLSPGASACSAGQFDEEGLKRKILESTKGQSNFSKKSFASFGSFGSAITVGLCPACIPAIGAFLSSIGLGFAVRESFLKPLLIVFLTFAVGGFLWSYLKVHRNILPLILGSTMAIVLYVGRYIYISGSVNAFLIYGGIVGIIAVSIWNLRLKKAQACNRCEVS